MSGKRLLDAAALLGAARSIAVQHAKIRAQQLDLYTKTSSIPKAFNGVTTSGQRFSAGSGQEQPATSSTTTPEPQPSPEQSQATNVEGIYQDHFYTPSEENSSRDPIPTESLKLKQKEEDTDALPDGTILPADSPSNPEGQSDKTPAENEEFSEEALQGLFHSPKARSLLSRSAKARKTPGGIGPRGSQTIHTLAGYQTRARFSTSSRHFQRSASSTEQDELKALAADIAKDVDASSKQQSPGKGGRQAQYEMRESRVPSSRIGRIFEYGGLAASMTMGALGEGIKRATGSSDGTQGSLMLSGGNMERLVAKLSKMRGAALKLGQMMSFQDAKLLPAPIHAVLQRVQDSADYMPASQRNAVLASNLGPNWRDLFGEFEEKPIAAASIGQVHVATIKSTGQKVAVKIQYPGVATSISSDLNNLSLLLTASSMLPRGLYLEKTIANARTELGWECDYIREAECGKRFQELLADERDTFVVPKVFDEASAKEVITMEFMEGVGVTKGQNFTQEQKDWIGTQILRLCLREIVEFNFMQTDPNWTNFLYNSKTNKLELLDFGASREYPKKFVDLYIGVLEAASRGDRKTCQKLSIELGYLTGYESPVMVRAHVDSILTLAEPFGQTAPDVYDFNNQTITDRVRELIPIMVKERLAPPPEETYSLHRKLSGAFLLCARLGSRIRCKELFQNALAGKSI